MARKLGLSKEQHKIHVREYQRVYQRKWRAEHREAHRRYCRESSKKNRDQKRLKVLSHYGLSCACCGESHIEFLGIDHINGGGTKHRKEIQLRGSSMYLWIIRNSFPPLFQTLCHNCNMAKGFYGQCPHKKK